MAIYYLQLRHAHICFVILSIALFCLRGSLMLAGSQKMNGPVLRYASYIIDTGLLTAALMLTTIVHQYPFTTGWLTMKVALLVLYVVLGSIALKRGTTRRSRTLAFVAALITVAFLVSVAVTHDPRGIFVVLASG
jgi:uncharacterized membrane protein SirB2